MPIRRCLSIDSIIKLINQDTVNKYSKSYLRFLPTHNLEQTVRFKLTLFSKSVQIGSFSRSETRDHSSHIVTCHTLL